MSLLQTHSPRHAQGRAANAPKVAQRLFLLAAIALALLLAGPARADSCPAVAADLRLGTDLPRVREAVRARREVVIVALGSSSTQGYGVTSTANTYPAQAGVTLTRRFERVHVKFVVINRGVGGEDVTEMLQRLERDVLAHRPDLVIWQAGTNAAMRGMDLASFERQLQAGVERLKAAGSDVVLMTPQYGPSVVALANEDDYVDVMHRVAARNGVGAFRRFDIMRRWVMHERMPWTRFMTSDGLHLNDFGQRCTGQLLARAIEGSVQPEAVRTTQSATTDTRQPLPAL